MKDFETIKNNVLEDLHERFNTDDFRILLRNTPFPSNDLMANDFSFFTYRAWYAYKQIEVFIKYDLTTIIRYTNLPYFADTQKIEDFTVSLQIEKERLANLKSNISTEVLNQINTIPIDILYHLVKSESDTLCIKKEKED